jgi:hypothetical protein
MTKAKKEAAPTVPNPVEFRYTGDGQEGLDDTPADDLTPHMVDRLTYVASGGLKRDMAGFEEARESVTARLLLSGFYEPTAPISAQPEITPAPPVPVEPEPPAEEDAP